MIGSSSPGGACGIGDGAVGGGMIFPGAGIGSSWGWVSSMTEGFGSWFSAPAGLVANMLLALFFAVPAPPLTGETEK